MPAAATVPLQGSWTGMFTSVLTAIYILLLLLARPPSCWTSQLTTAITSALPHLSDPLHPSPKPIYNIGAVFDVENISFYVLEFNRAIKEINSQNDVRLEAREIVLRPDRNISANFHKICDAIRQNNITAFFVVGTQHTINLVSIVTKHVGIPVIGYKSDRNTIAVRGERPLYLQFDPSKALIARALVRTMEMNDWHDASLILEDDYASDGFLENFKRLTTDEVWSIEDKVVLSRKMTKSAIDYKLHVLLENQSRVMILHASVEMARLIFEVASNNGFTDKGYAWFVTEDVVTRREVDLKSYPVGLVAFTIDYSVETYALLRDAVTLVSKATERFVANRGNALLDFARQSACNVTPNKEQYKLMDAFYRYLKDTEFTGATGIVTFDQDGMRSDANFKLLNLIKRPMGRKKWKKVGSLYNDTFKMTTVVWPGNTVSGPITKGERMLRVVTNIMPPFVMQADAMQGKCTTAVPCLRVQTKEKEMLEDIFKDFRSGIHNDSRPYIVKCCQGLSVMLLERLARDLNFNYQLYITKDEKYGRPVYTGPDNETWDGLVEDLQKGAAHMAVAAFSITKSRSQAIDFTDPYFFSGFAILVAERERETPIYAFMEPFDGWVWISIVISATVVAVAVSLLEWNSPFGLNPWGRKRKVNYTFGSALNMVYAIFFQHTTKTKSPKAWPSKFVQNFWAGASIFIYSSYTANLAAFLAGKNSGVTITGIHDPKLMESGRKVGIIEDNAVVDFLSRVNMQVFSKTTKYNNSLAIESVITMLGNDELHAYLDDTSILEYARTTMDAKCLLRIIGQGFGEDGYGIGLPKGSHLKLPLTKKILEYHESGYMEDLKDLYFRRSKCNANINDGQLQGTALPMVFTQHAGLYLLLLVGIFVCIVLMFLEHATFKWLVPYWRGKPSISFWKSYSMMFWSQRLYRIITSEELVSPHHSAREMIEVVKNRDFTKLFQKSVRKQERQARNRKNLFSIVEQLQWKQRREERLSQHPSVQTDYSVDSDNSATPVNVNRQICRLDETATTDTNDDNTDDWPANWEKEWIAEGSNEPTSSLYRAGHVNHSFNSHTDLLQLDSSHDDTGQSASSHPNDDDNDNDDENSPLRPVASDDRPLSRSAAALDILDYSSIDDVLTNCTDLDDDPHLERFGAGVPLLAKNSCSEDNLIRTHLPNGMLIVSPNGEVIARDVSTGKSVIVRPKAIVNLKQFATNLPQRMKTLPSKGKSANSSSLSRSRTLEKLSDSATNSDGEPAGLPFDQWTKEQLYYLWKSSEIELNARLQKALAEKAALEEKLREMSEEEMAT